MLILTVLQGPDKGRLFELPDNEPQMIGRSSEALPLGDQTISRRHAALTPDEGQWYIVDLDSANGTFVNGKRVEGRRLLKPGDQVRTGVTLFVFGMDGRTVRRRNVQVLRPGQIDVHVEKTAAANDESIMVIGPQGSDASALQLRVFYALSELLTTVADRQHLLERVMDLIFEHFDADRGFILLQENPHERPDPVVVRHRLAVPGQEQPAINVSRNIVQYVLGRKAGVLSTNAMTDKRFGSSESIQAQGIRSALCVPIKFKDRLFGVIHIDSLVANYTFTEDQLRLLTAIGVHTGLALANGELYAAKVQQERLAAVGQTVASLSHSIKNILQGMRGGADVVELGLKKQNMKVVDSGWVIVSRNLERIFELTLNMLAYSKQRTPEFEMVNLNKLLEEAVHLVQKQYDAKHVALISDLDPEMPPVPLDAAGLHQALLNLLNNALDAVEPETGAVTLRCEFQDAAQAIRLAVSDNGVGIEPERQKRLFQPFHSTKGLKGTGLGLVVTKKIVEEHGGAITVESRPGSTTFTITLPLDRSLATGSTLSDTMDPHLPQASGR